MEINQQLFEDVLSGKLKGTFVLRNGNTFDGKCLKRAENTTLYYNPFYPYYLISDDSCESFFESSYTEGGMWCRGGEFSNDIIEFIPDTDMKENELTIKLPKGKIVDWDESKKQNKIVLKDKAKLTYEEMCDKLFPKSGSYYYVNNYGNISTASSRYNPYISNPNSATTEHQLECILAKNMLANVAVYLNNGWKPIKGDHVFAIKYYGDCKDRLIISEHYFGAGENLVLFRTQKDAKKAIEILGEETVKLALEPLGI